MQEMEFKKWRKYEVFDELYEFYDDIKDELNVSSSEDKEVIDIN